ncbi:MAG TPA: hypothetical protein VJ417_01700 [Candidatus Glassbacteria bacterium]|nr:hypothetical protein [Candidatus Glassbacteria bacterium]
MPADTIELFALSVIVVLMLAGYLWLRHGQTVRRRERERKLHCKELILDKRVLLAKAGTDFDELVELVKMKISPEQLEKVIGLLISRLESYNIDAPESSGSEEVDLGFERKEATEAAKAKASGDETAGLADIGLNFDKMGPEQEKAWLRMAHARFRQALADKDIVERQPRFRLLVKMIELGKKAVEEDAEKPVKRKAYEIELWDRFYENEYIELNSES